MTCDTTFFTLKAGAAGPWRSLQEYLRQAHDDARALTASAIAQREKMGIPLDDKASDWRADVEEILRGLKTAKRADASDLLRKAMARASEGLQPLGEYIPDPSIEGVEVRLRALSRADVLDMQAELASVDAEVGDGDESPAARAARLRSAAARIRVIRPFLAKAIAGVRGVQLEDGEAPAWEGDECPAFVLAILDEQGLIGALFSMARDYQSLSGKARGRFALPHRSTSETSTAASVPAPVESYSDVTAALLASTLPATPTSRPIAVPEGTNSISDGAVRLSTSGASLTVPPESTGFISRTSQ